MAFDLSPSLRQDPKQAGERRKSSARTAHRIARVPEQNSVRFPLIRKPWRFEVLYRVECSVHLRQACTNSLTASFLWCLSRLFLLVRVNKLSTTRDPAEHKKKCEILLNVPEQQFVPGAASGEPSSRRPSHPSSWQSPSLPKINHFETNYKDNNRSMKGRWRERYR